MSQPRKAKSDGVRQERRNRSGSTGALSSKLSLPSALKDDKDHVYRWVNDGDSGDRLSMLYNRDWDYVREAGGAYESVSDMKNTLRRRVGTQKSGEPLFAYLMRKPKHMYDEDVAKGQGVIDDNMNNMRRGGLANEASALEGASYVPKEGIKLNG